jgi:hypothetical protein
VCDSIVRQMSRKENRQILDAGPCQSGEKPPKPSTDETDYADDLFPKR